MSAVAASFMIAALASLPASCQERSIAVEDVAFVELSSPRTTYFEQEPFRLTLRFGLEREFLSSRVIQPFSRELDLPVQLEAPWLEELAGAVRVTGEEQGASEAERSTFVLNGEIAEAEQGPDRERNGRDFVVLELEGRFLARQPGELAIPATILRLAHATRFEPDFFGASVPAARENAVVTGNALVLRIEPLPGEGRPDGFTNAVGRFDVSAEAEPRELEVGAALKVVLRIEGAGNFELLEVPPLVLAGFHLLGKVEEKSAARRTVTYDLTPLSADVRELPPIRFVYFDPGDPPGYRTVETRPIPLRVLARPEDARAASETSAVESGSAEERERPTSPLPWITAVLAVCLVAIVVGSWSLRRRARRADPAAERARDAAAAFRENVARAGTDAGAAFTEYLAARLSCTSAAVISPDLERRLAARGAPTDLARRAARALDELVAARYGGRAHVAGEELTALVNELEAALREGRPSR